MSRALWMVFLAVVACRQAADTGRIIEKSAPTSIATTSVPMPKTSPREIPPAHRPAEESAYVSASLRKQAIGSTDDLPTRLRRAFDPAGFEPLGKPGPADWLANHPESGQTYAQFVASRPKAPDARRRAIDLLPLGEFASGRAPELKVLTEYVNSFFSPESRAMPGLPLSATLAHSRVNSYTGKRQLYSRDILANLIPLRRPDAFCLAALTMEDLYPDPSWNFVFGEALYSHGVGVYSFARYDPAFYGEKRGADYLKLILRRSVKVMAHELGHLFGLDHCIYFRCLMNGANHLDEADSRPQHLCPVCLRKLYHSIHFDPAERYRRLEAFYRRVGMQSEADFAAQRAASIERP